jgi:L,D-transpeptidase catalytic domain
VASSVLAVPARAPSDRPTARRGSVPPPIRPAFAPGRPHLLPAGETASRWAPVRRAVAARARPDGPVVARLGTTTPEGTANLVLVLEPRQDASGRLWVRVRLPVLPNDLTAWVPRDALGGYGIVHTHLVVELDRLTATLTDRGRSVFRARVGVGRDGWPTPRGEFYIRNRLTEFASPTYGPIAFGTSARSVVLTDWPDGGFVGIHGTDRPDLLPGRVSHGCIRMRNADILRLARLMPVGTPMTVR